MPALPRNEPTCFIGFRGPGGTSCLPVQREEVRVEREPVSEADAGHVTREPEISEEEQEVVLHEEEPVVEKRTVPKERVRLEKDTVVGEEHVSEEVRKEQIEAEGDPPGGAT